MPRPKMVTRTITSSELTVLFVNTETEETKTEKITVVGDFKTIKSAMSYLNKRVFKDRLNGNFIPVTVTNIETSEQRYGMSEDDFINYSSVLPPLKSGDEEPEKHDASI